MNISDLKQSFDLYDDINLYNFDESLQLGGTDFCWGSVENSIVLANSRLYFKKALENPLVKCIIAPEQFIPSTKITITTQYASDLFHLIHNKYFYEKDLISHSISQTANISPQAIICPPVFIGDNVTIGAGAYIGKNTILRDNCFIAPNCTIGTEGMLAKVINGTKQHITHYGSVIVGEGSYIHASTNISKGVHLSGKTIIGTNCHIGIGVNIAHDVSIGNDTEVSGKTNIAGRSSIGNNVWIGANSTVSNWITIGDNAKVRLGSTVIKNVPKNEDVSGNFALPHKTHLRKFIAGENE